MAIDREQKFDRTDTNWRANAGLDWDLTRSTSLAGDFTYYAIETDSEPAT